MTEPSPFGNIFIWLDTWVWPACWRKMGLTTPLCGAMSSTAVSNQRSAIRADSAKPPCGMLSVVPRRHPTGKARGVRPAMNSPVCGAPPHQWGVVDRPGNSISGRRAAFDSPTHWATGPQSDEMPEHKRAPGPVFEPGASSASPRSCDALFAQPPDLSTSGRWSRGRYSRSQISY